MERAPHLGWRKSRWLPHFDEPAQVQHVIFRLRGSVPRSVETLLPTDPTTRFEAYEVILDRGDGPSHLADPRAAGSVAETLRWADGARYHLLAWCVMPTHVHVLIEQIEGWPLHRVVGGWKSFSARRITAALDLPGSFWAKDYFDRAMRDERQSANAQAYIEYNPVKAGLCADPSDWKWSSAYKEVGEDADRPNGWRVGVLTDPPTRNGASDGT